MFYVAGRVKLIVTIPNKLNKVFLSPLIHDDRYKHATVQHILEHMLC